MQPSDLFGDFRGPTLASVATTAAQDYEMLRLARLAEAIDDARLRYEAGQIDFVCIQVLNNAGLTMAQMKGALVRMQRMGLPLCPACAIFRPLPPPPPPDNGPDAQGYHPKVNPSATNSPGGGTPRPARPEGPPDLRLCRRANTSLTPEEQRRRRGGRVQLSARAPLPHRAGFWAVLLINAVGFWWAGFVGLPLLAQVHAVILVATLVHARWVHLELHGKAPARARILDAD